MSELFRAIAMVTEPLALPLAKLIMRILESPNPSAELTKAEKALMADAADDAADRALGLK